MKMPNLYLLVSLAVFCLLPRDNLRAFLGAQREERKEETDLLSLSSSLIAPLSTTLQVSESSVLKVEGQVDHFDKIEGYDGHVVEYKFPPHFFCHYSTLQCTLLHHKKLFFLHHNACHYATSQHMFRHLEKGVLHFHDVFHCANFQYILHHFSISCNQNLLVFHFPTLLHMKLDVGNHPRNKREVQRRDVFHQAKGPHTCAHSSIATFPVPQICCFSKHLDISSHFSNSIHHTQKERHSPSHLHRPSHISKLICLCHGACYQQSGLHKAIFLSHLSLQNRPSPNQSHGKDFLLKSHLHEKEEPHFHFPFPSYSLSLFFPLLQKKKR
mmetsp:Transcript_32028/g.43875  ORF Transcript_32028/g.43875 Transcript_32028/m.43875 type:complete len:326 (-) Transcript_32028:50-1027(-)